MIVWHYTYRDDSHLGSILADGVLRLEGEGGRYLPRTRRAILVPGVWFSTNEVFEPSAVKPVTQNGITRQLTIEESLPDGVRIGVDSAGMMTWSEFKMRVPVIANLSKHKRAEAMNGFARMETLGNPSEWYVSLKRVPRARWLALQIWESGQWVDMPPATQMQTSNSVGSSS